MELVSENNIKTIDFVTKVENRLGKGSAYKSFIKAEGLRAQKEYKLSIVEYLKAIFLDRNNPKTFLGLGISYKNTQNYDKALKFFEKAKSLCSTDFEIFYNLGITQLILNRPTEAISNLQNAILLDKNNLNAQIQMAIAHEFMNEEYMALSIYQKIIDENPAYLVAYNHKVALLMKMEMFSEAASLFNTILKINPDFYRAYLGIALCFDKLNRPKDAIRYYSKYVAMKPNAINSKKVQKRIKELKECKYTSKNDLPEYLNLV